MDIVNRSAVILRPKQSYLEWTKLDDTTGIAEDVFSTMRTEPSVYLVPGWEDPKEEREIMGEFWPALFEAMLSAWVTDEALWPADRTRKMFDEWFGSLRER